MTQEQTILQVTLDILGNIWGKLLCELSVARGDNYSIILASSKYAEVAYSEIPEGSTEEITNLAIGRLQQDLNAQQYVNDYQL